MTYEIERAKEELIQALDKLNESAMDDAKDQLLNDSKKLARHLFEEAACGWSVEVGGLEWAALKGDQPLTIYVYDHEGEGLLYKHDPVEALLYRTTPQIGGKLASKDEEPPAQGEADALQMALYSLAHAAMRIREHAAFRGIEVD